jgi:hypothetical protein
VWTHYLLSPPGFDFREVVNQLIDNFVWVIRPSHGRQRVKPRPLQLKPATQGRTFSPLETADRGAMVGFYVIRADMFAGRVETADWRLSKIDDKA